MLLLLFVLAMRALTKLFHSKVEILCVGESNRNMDLNRLLGIDDLKLLFEMEPV